MWALGVILYIILIKYYPFKSKLGVEETIRQIVEAELTFESKIEKSLSIEARHLLSMLLHKDKIKRYSMKDIVSHPWLDDVIDVINDETPLTKLKSKLAMNAIKDEIKKKVINRSKLISNSTFAHLYF